MNQIAVLFSYDVVENRRRAKLAALLQKVANRIQNSVFVGKLTPQLLDETVDSAKKIINLKTDTLYISKYCSNCWDKILEIGQAHKFDEEVCLIVF